MQPCRWNAWPGRGDAQLSGGWIEIGLVLPNARIANSELLARGNERGGDTAGSRNNQRGCGGSSKRCLSRPPTVKLIGTRHDALIAA